MKVLMIGDVVGSPGRRILKEQLPRIKRELGVAAVIVNAENAAAGSGITVALANEIFAAGADAITLGDHIVVQRREFLSNIDVGADWVIPLPVAEPKPFTFAARARVAGVPAFPAGAALKVSAVKAKTRGGSSRDGKTKIPRVEKDAVRIEIPAASAGAARSYEFEVVAESKAPGGVRKSKLVIAEGYNHSAAHKKATAPSYCVFARDELPGRAFRFTVTPSSCFENRGVPLVADWTASPEVSA